MNFYFGGKYMIFYFSGTGNSLYVAKDLAKNNNETLISISALVRENKASYQYTLKDDEAVGFVYPIYAWAPPKMVLEFIEKLEFKNYKDNYIFSVATCGANIGNTVKIIEKILENKKMELNSAFSVAMPSNYIIMGDVEAKEEQNKKLSAVDIELKDINEAIGKRVTGMYDIEKGSFSWVRTSIINTLFSKAISTKKFYADDKCTGCGICEKVCNCGTIKVDKKPVWGDKCVQCLACVNLCPAKAIQYGKSTESKGRYKNPKISLEELKII